MLNGKRVLAVVPARGGSKGIKLKNLRKIAGKSLIAHVGEVLKNLPFIDRKIVSTDHIGIADEAELSGISAPFFRPEEISGDRISDYQVLNHALLQMEEIDNTQYDVVVMLQPTSPLRTPDQVLATVEKLVKEDLDSVWTVSPTDLKYHPLKQLVISDNNGLMDYFDDKGPTIIARQQLSTTYHRNGVSYAISRNCLLREKSIFGAKCGAVVINSQQVSIDTEEDIELVSELTQRNMNAF